jgi:hypothetical protein
MVRPIGDNDARQVTPLPHRDKIALYEKAKEMRVYATEIVRELIQGFLRGEIKLPSSKETKKG